MGEGMRGWGGKLISRGVHEKGEREGVGMCVYEIQGREGREGSEALMDKGRRRTTYTAWAVVSVATATCSAKAATCPQIFWVALLSSALISSVTQM